MEMELSTPVAARQAIPAGQPSTRSGPIRLIFIDNLRRVMYAVHVFHPPILIAISLGMAGLHRPPLIKFVLLTLASIIVTYSVCALIVRRIPLLQKIL